MAVLRRVAAIWRTTLAVVGGLVLLALYGLALWQAPELLVNQDLLNHPQLGPANRLAAEHSARLIVISVGGALVVVTGLLYTARNYRLAHRGQVTERFTKALERLGSDELYVRIGGVHALEHVMLDSTDHHGDVVEVLVAFIRDRVPRRAEEPIDEGRWMHPPIGTDPPELPSEPAADVQAALTALGQRPKRVSYERGRLNFQELHLRGTSLVGAHLQNANLWKVQLRGADLSEAQLQGADLREAQLQNTDLSEAQLQDANLWRAQLQDAELARAQLQGANLWSAQFRDANLADVQLQGAYLRNALLQGANMAGAQLEDATLAGAQLQGANLAGAQLWGANLRGAQLQGANLAGAQLWLADLTRAQLQDVDLAGAKLEGAKLKDAQLQGANLAGARVTSKQLESAVMWQAEVDADQLSGDQAEEHTSLPDGFTGHQSA